MSSSQTQLDAPRLTALLSAYARWQHFGQEPVQDTATPRNLPGYDQHAHLSIPLSLPLAFLMSCPYIDAQDLPEDERNCPVCTDPYHPLSDRGRDNSEVKLAQRLPCGHYLCDKCMLQWLEPFGASNNNTCPFDRRILFPKLPPPLDTEGIRIRQKGTYADSNKESYLGGIRGLIRNPETAAMYSRQNCEVLIEQSYMGYGTGYLFYA